LTLAFSPCLPSGSAAESSAGKITRLIKDLGSDEYTTREAATSELKKIEEAVPALRKAAASGDAEVQRRAAEILEGFRERQLARALRKATTLAKEGRIDEAIERLVLMKRLDDEEPYWDPLMRLAAQLDDTERRSFGKIGIRKDHRLYMLRPVGAYREYTRKQKLKVVDFPRGVLEDTAGSLIRGKDVSLKGETSYCVVAASGNVSGADLYFSVIFSNGDVKLDKVYCSIIVCDGNVELGRLLQNSVVIARRVIALPRDTGNCVVMADEVRSPINAGVGSTLVDTGNVNPLGVLKFFDPKDLGLAVTRRPYDAEKRIVPTGLLVHVVGEGKLLSTALRPGDVIHAIDGQKAPTPEDFRKLLRKRLAQEELAITFTIERAGKTLEVPVTINK
jgi:hypothetical protein